MFEKHLGHVFGFVAKAGLERFLHHAGEAVASLIAPFDELSDDAADFAERVRHIRRVLAGEVDNFHRIPHDVILTHGLEPECLDADGTAADL